MAMVATLVTGCGGALAPDRGLYYGGYDALIIDEGLINFLVTMEGVDENKEITDYADCIAARYALDRGAGFARHVRTNVSERAGIWRADAVYTISPTLPQGLRTIDTEVAVQNCAANGIPTD